MVGPWGHGPPGDGRGVMHPPGEASEAEGSSESAPARFPPVPHGFVIIQKPERRDKTPVNLHSLTDQQQLDEKKPKPDNILLSQRAPKGIEFHTASVFRVIFTELFFGTFCFGSPASHRAKFKGCELRLQVSLPSS
ncbi:hypothetical protein GOODEAATRI_002024 [Goodea atripinnis]|uniref:Uncharacterized protein n=1 Tax=Goodea atripinnis TaxID=208336 RepID=A0ABV0P0S9_9TELE